MSAVTATQGTGTGTGTVRRRRSAWIQRRDRRGIWFVVPFLVGFVLFMIVPLVYAIYTSLYTTKIIGGTVFSGASNYTQTLQSSQFWSGVVRVVIYAAIQIPVMLAIAFFFATVFDLGVAKFGRTFRTIFFIPFAVPAVVGAVMWSFLLEPQFGPMVHLANAFGFAGTNFFSPSLILPSIIVIVIWEWTGYNMVILYTALKSVPRDVVEAAILDDTPLWRIIVRIKLPLVRPAIVMLGATMLSAFAGYGFSRFSFRSSKVLFYLTLAALLVPITALTLPLYLTYAKAHLINSIWGMILPSMISAVGIYLMKVYTDISVPRELIDAARIDGGGEARIFFRVALPLMVPGFMTVLLISVVSIWNNYFLPLLIFNVNTKYPLTVGLGLWSERAQNSGNAQLFPMVVIGGLVTIIPLIALFLLLQRYWRGGLLLGSIAN